MSKKNFVAKNSSKLAKNGQKSTQAKQPVIDRLVDDASESQLASALDEVKVLPEAVQHTDELAQETQEDAQDKELAEIEANEQASDKVLSSVEPIDRGGESLLMEVATEESKDKAAAKINDKDDGGMGDMFPLLAGLAGLAALAGGGGGNGPTNALPPGFQGIVFDTPVTNAIVFRDSNDNGKWDANEAIAVTDSNGNYSGLTGSGNIIATSLDRLVGWDGTKSVYYNKPGDTIVINGKTMTVNTQSGYAIDVGADARLNTADDFVWSGTYVIGAGLQGDGSAKVYITAVTSLVTAYLSEKGVTAPTQDQLNSAIAELKTLFVFDGNSGVKNAGTNVQFLTGELNGQVTKIMGDAIARAETANTSVQDAIKAAVTALAQAAKNATSVDPIDLTSAPDLQAIIFPTAANASDDVKDMAMIRAEALALQTATTGPAVYSVWFDENGTHVERVSDELSTHGYDAKTAVGDFSADARPVGNITVLANEDKADVSLDVAAVGANGAVNFQAARLLAHAAGDGSTSSMNVVDGKGEVTSVNVKATGGIDHANEEQAIDLLQLQDETFVSGDVINLILNDADSTVLSYTLTSTDLTYSQTLVNNAVTAFRSQIAEDELGIKLDVVNGQLLIVWEDEADHDLVELGIFGGATIEAEEAIKGGTPIYTSADLDLSLNGKITDGIEVLASNTSTDATAHIDGDLSVAGDMSVTASGTNSYAEATVNGGETGATVLGSVNAGDDLTVTASGDNAEANATLNHASGRMDQVGVNSTGDDSYACADVTVEADKTLTVQSVTLVANSAQVDGTGADADAYFRGETGQLGDQRNWETLNDVATDHGKLVIAGNISVTAVGAGDWAYLGVNEEENDHGYTVLGGGGIQIMAQGENASADVVMRNVDGAAGDIDVVATGTSAIQGFNFLSFFDPDPNNGEKRLAAGNVIKLSVGDDFVQYTVTAPEVRNAVSINALLESIVASFNTQADNKDLGVSFSSTNTGPYSNADKGLFVTWDSIRREEPATIELTQGVITTDITDFITTPAYELYFVSKDGSVESAARLDIQTENNGLNAGAVTVTADAEDASADADILGDTGISGEINVTASEVDAEALLHINDEGDHTTTLSGKHDISITASAENTDAHATLGNASGVAGDITVVASESSAEASFSLNAADEFSAENLTVQATADNTDAMAMLIGDISIHGDLSSTAEGNSAYAQALVNVYGEDSSTLGKTVAGVDVGSNITVDAIGAEAIATVAVFNAAGTVGSVDVTATGNSADAIAVIAGEYTIQGDITVTANQTNAEAWMGHYMVPDQGTATFEDSNITVTATGQSADAMAMLANTAGSIDDITVTASTSSHANATVLLGTEEAKQLDIHTVTLLSSSTQSDTSVILQGNVDITSDVEITAQGLQSDASADFNGVIAVDGNIDVHATGEDSRAELTANQIDDIDQDEDLDQTQSSVLGGGDIHLQASGTDATAQVIIHQASGNTGAVHLEGTGDDAQTYLEVGAQADKTLRVESITLNADSTAVGGSDAWADAYFRGETGKVSNQNRWTDLNTLSTDHGTVQVDGNISVTAEGDSDWAYLGLNDGGPEGSNNDRGYTKLNQIGNDADITIRASGTDSSAEAWVNNAAGTAGDITVEATGTHEVQGFDFLYYFRPELGEALLWKDEFKITVDGETYTYVVGKNETRNAEGINALLNKVVAEFNTQAAGDGITFSVDFSGPSPFAKGVFVTWDTVRDEPAQISVAHKHDANQTTTNITNAEEEAQYFFVKDGTVNSDAYLELNTEYTGVTAQSLTVTADAEDSTAASDISGDVAIRGDITVTAAELDADAYADINGEGNGLTALGGLNASALDVHATVDGADASLVIGNASGSATSVDVRATADDTSAYLSLQALEEDGNTLSIAGAMNVVANGVDASADADISTTSAALQEINVTADELRASAEVLFTASGNVSASSLNVTSNGQDAYADFRIAADEVTIRGDIDVKGTGDGTYARGVVNHTAVLGTQAAGSNIDVQSTGVDAEARLSVRDASGRVTGINLSVTGNESIAALDLDDHDGIGATELNIDGPVSVNSLGTNADAYATIDGSNAQLVDIEISALGNSADADMYMDIEDELTVGSVSVTASGNVSRADADIIGGDATISGDISVSSNGVDSIAAAHINEDRGTTALSGNNDLTVSSTGLNSQADLHIHNASGSVDAVDVSASGNEAYSTLNVSVESGEKLTMNTVSLSADSAGLGADADVYFRAASTDATVVINGDILLEAQDETDWAYLGVNDGGPEGANTDNGRAVLGGGDLSLNANGEDAIAEAYIYNASGSVGDISLNARNLFADASLDINASGELSINSLSVIASGLVSTADADIDGDLSIAGNINVDASDVDSTAAAHINEDNGTIAFTGNSDITVNAAGLNTEADLHIHNASGNVDDITVLADNVCADANLGLTVDSELTAHSLTVTASGWSADAGTDVSGDVSILGDVDVTASGMDAMATAQINTDGNGTTTFGQTISGDVVGSAIDVTASGTTSLAGVSIQNVAGVSIQNVLGTVNTLTVTASGDRAGAMVNVDGDFVIQSNITFTASGDESMVMAGVNTNGGDATTSVELQGGNITTTASGTESFAAGGVINANGQVGNLDITASGESSDAILYVSTDADALEIENINVLSSGEEAQALGQVSGDVHITGDINVTASGLFAQAGNGINAPVEFSLFSFSPVSIETQLGDATGGSNITVEASGVYSSADSNMGSVFGFADAIEVTASNNSADANLDIATMGEGLTVNTLTVTASSLDAVADADIDGVMRFTGDINVLASGSSASASSHLEESVTVGTADQSADIFVDATAVSADAELIVTGELTMSGDISLDAAASESVAKLHVIGDLTMTGNISGNSTASSDTAETSSYVEVKVTSDVDLVGNFSVESSGRYARSSGQLTGRDDGTTTINVTGDISVTASGQNSYSNGDFAQSNKGAMHVVGNVNSTASATDADSRLTIWGDLDIEGDINITSSANASDAQARIRPYSSRPERAGQELTMTGDVNVLSDGEDSNALAEMWGEGNDINLTGDVNVTSAGNNSKAVAQLGDNVRVDEVGGIVDMTGNLNVTASDLSADAEAYFNGSIDFTGDMSFDASAQDAVTTVEFNGEYDSGYSVTEYQVGTSVLDVGTLRLESSGEDSLTQARIDEASGTVDLVSVNATGDNADSYLQVEVEVENTLSVETINVRANSDMSATGDSSTADAYLFGKTGDIPEQDRWKLLDSESTDHGTVEINGNITVTAAGYNDSAYLGVNDSGPTGETSDDGYTVVNGGNVTLAATGTDSEVETYIHNANGTLTDVSVTAGGNSEVQGFDFLHYFRPSGGRDLQANDVFSFTVDGHTLSYKVKVGEFENTTKINALLETVVASFNAQAEELHLSLQFTSSYIETDRETSRLVPFEKGLFATWDSIRNEAAAVIALDTAATVGAVTIPGNAVDGNNKSYFHTDNGNENSTAYFELKTENGGVTIETLTVIASAKLGDSSAYISGDVAITGDILVSATEIDAKASADIGGDMTDTILGHMSNDVPVGSNVTVEATNTSSNAQADIDHVSGYVADLAVQATGDDSIADLFMEIEADKTLTLETITVNANSTASGGSSAEANAYLRGENGTIADQDRWSELNDDSTDHGTVAIEGEITVTAGGTDDLAYLGVNDTGPDSNNDDRGYTILGKNGTGSDLTVQATGTDASAEAYIYNATGTVADITVEASGSHEVQGFDLLYFFRPNDGEIRLRAGDQITYTVGDNAALVYTVTEDDARNVVGINAMLEKIVVQFNAQAGDLGVTFESTHLDPLSPFEKGLFATWDTIRDEEAAVINYVPSLGVQTTITGHPNYGDYFYTKDGTVDSDAYLDLQTENGGVTADSLTVTASAESSYADTDITGNVDILGDITVSASELSADAYAYINGEDGGTTTLGEEVAGRTVGSAISVTASDTTTEAAAMIRNVLGTVDTLTVTASGGNTGSDEFWDRSFACADVAGDFVIQSDITITASGDKAWAMAGVNAVCNDTITSATMEGGDITVTASGDESLALSFINNVNGLAGDVTVSATGESSDALLWASTDAEALEMDDLSVLSSAEDSQAVAVVSGDVHITGDISVTASGLSALASTDVNADGDIFFMPFSVGPVIQTELGAGAEASNISVVSSGQGAKATAGIGNGNGTVGDVTVSASGSYEGGDYEQQVYLLSRLQELASAVVPFEIKRDDRWTRVKIDGITLQTQNSSLFGSPQFFADLNLAAQVQGIDVSFSAPTDDDGNVIDGIVIDWNTFGPQNKVDFEFGGSGSRTIWQTYNPTYPSREIRDAIDSRVLGTDLVNSEADLDMHLDGTIEGNLDVAATNVETSADAVINGELTLEGDISVTASGMSADAVADINRDGSETTTLAVGEITVTASAEDAFADLNIDNAKGSTGHIAVAATSEDSNADVDLWVADAQNVTIASMSLDASGYDASADLTVNGLSDTSTVTVTGDIDVSATGNVSDAGVYLMDNDDRQGRVVLGGGDIVLNNLADAAETHVHIFNASGSVGAINLLNTGEDTEDDDAYAHVELEAGAGQNLTIESMNLVNQSGDGSVVNVDLWTGSGDSNIFITGDISVTAQGANTDARIEFNEESTSDSDANRDTMNTGTITLGKTVNGQTMGSNISVLANGDESDADAYMYNLAGSAGNIHVEASGDSVESGFYPEFQRVDTDNLIAKFAENGASIDNGYVIVLDGIEYEVEAGTEGTRQERLIAALPEGVTATFASWQIQIIFSDDQDHAPAAFKFQKEDNAWVTVGLYDIATDPNVPREVPVFTYPNAAEAYTEMELDGTVEGDILVKASGLGGDADMEAGGSITVKGDVEVLASGQDAYADLDFNDDDEDTDADDNIDNNDDAITTMAGGNYRVAATGTEAYAESELMNAMGNVGALSVEATGESAEADFEGVVEADKTLTVASVNVLANSYGQDMAYSEAYLKGETGVDAEQTPWEYLTEDDIDHGTVAITGNITVNALGAQDEAYLQVNTYWGEDGDGNFAWFKDDGYTVLGGGDISVTAAGTHSWADGRIANALGTVGDITVNAQGAAEVQGFDFLYFFRPAGGEMTIGRDQVFTYTVAGEVFTYNITTTDFPLNDTVPRAIRINTLLNSIVESFNEQAEEKGLDVSFSNYYDGPTFDNGLFITWENRQDNALVEIRLNDTLIAESVEDQDEELIYKDYFFTQDGTKYNDAYLELQNEIRGVTADSLTVTATAESGEAHADILGNVTILGDISVNASELYANAKAHVNADHIQNVTSVNLLGALLTLTTETDDSFNPLTDRVDFIINGQVYNLSINDDYAGPDEFIADLNQEFESAGISFQWMPGPEDVPFMGMISINWPIGQEHGTFQVRADGITIGMEEILAFQEENPDVPDLYLEEEVVGEGAELIGDTVLGGGDITVTSSGSVSYEEAVVSLDTEYVSMAEAVVHNATGSIGSIMVSSSGAPLTRDVEGALGAVTEVQTIDFDDFFSWDISNDDGEDTSDTTWTLTVDAGESGEDHVFNFSGDDWTDLVNNADTEGMGFTFSVDASGDLVIAWESGDVYDYDLAVMHGEGTITRGKDWVTQELVNEWEIQAFDVACFDTAFNGSSTTYLDGGEDTTLSITINGTTLSHTVTSSTDTLESIVNAWDESAGPSIDIDYYDNGTTTLDDDWFEVSVTDNKNTEHSVDVSFSWDTGFNSDDVEIDSSKVQMFDSNDVDDIVDAVDGENMDGSTTWTLNVGGHSYSVDIDVDAVVDTDNDGSNMDEVLFDVIASWDENMSSEGFSLNWNECDDWFEVVWADSADASLVTINVTGSDGNTAKEIDIGVLAEFTSQDGVQTGNNWSTPGNQEVQKFYFDKFSSWSSYDTSNSADETITSVEEDWKIIVYNGSFSPYANSKDAQFTMSSNDLINLLSEDSKVDLLEAWQAASNAGNFDMTISIDQQGGYFTVIMGDYNGWNDSQDQAYYVDHAPTRFETERVITREATWSEDNLSLDTDFEMTDGFSSRTYCEHEYIPSISVLDLEFSGAISGDVTVESTNVAAESYATIHGELSISGDITLRATGDESIAELLINQNDNSLDIAFSNDIRVSVTGDDAQATLVLNGLVGEVKTLTVNVTGEDALATTDLVFNQYGSVKTTNINVVHRGEALVTLDQSMEDALVQDTGPVGLTPFNTGTVSASGEGHVGLTYMVDSSAVTAKTIDLRSLNQTMVNGEATQKTWGYADIDLVAKWENGDAQGPQFTSITTLFPKIMEIKGFNVDRDVINLSHVIDPALPLPQEAVVSDYYYVDSSDVNSEYFVGGDDTLIVDLETSGAYFEAVQDLLADATLYFRDEFLDSDTKSLGYFYREIQFEFGRTDEFGSGDASVIETRSFLVYDFDLNNSAASGIITFGSTTGLTERNVTERYALIQEDDSSDTVNTFEGYHNIDLFNAASVLDGDNSASYDLGEDADVMINDIVVTAYETMESDGITFVTSGDVSLDISGDDDSSLQLRQSEILVAADRENTEALLSVSDAWGTVSSLKLHGYLGGVVGASISNIDYMNVEEYQNAISDDDGGNDDNGVYVGHLDNGLYIRDVEVIADGNLSIATLSLDVDGFIDTMKFETLGFGSSIDAVIDQAEYGGEVFISGSNLTEEHASCDCIDEVGDNVVNLNYVNGTAAKIVIDNAGREPLAGADIEDDESIAFNLIFSGEDFDKDLNQFDAWDQMVTIEGWTQNDTINFKDDAGSADDYQHYAGQLLDFDEQGKNTLLRNAFDALEEVDYYFGQMGGNGYLFYDEDSDGLTMIVEFLGVTTFDYTKIVGGSNGPI